MKNIKVLVIDGQGGGIGKSLVQRLAQENLPIDIVALGTNSAATNQMIKAGATKAATGENAIIVQCKKADIIMGVIGILAANSLMGELSPAMAVAIGESDAQKILIPLTRCHISITCSNNITLSDHLDDAIIQLKSFLENELR